MSSGKALHSYTVTIHDLCWVLAWFLLKSTRCCKENILSTLSKLLHPKTSLVQHPTSFCPVLTPKHQKYNIFNGRASITGKLLQHLIYLVSLNSRIFFLFQASKKEAVCTAVLPIAATTVWKLYSCCFLELQYWQWKDKVLVSKSAFHIKKNWGVHENVLILGSWRAENETAVISWQEPLWMQVFRPTGIWTTHIKSCSHIMWLNTCSYTYSFRAVQTHNKAQRATHLIIGLLTLFHF